MEFILRYGKERYDIKAKRYSRALRYIFGVSVDPVTIDRWSDLIRLARGIDNYLDHGDASNLLERTRVVNEFLLKPQVLRVQFPALAADRLGQDTYRTMQNLGHAIVGTNLEVTSAKTLPEYVRARRTEGALYANLICSIAAPETSAQPGYAAFSRWIVPTGEVTNLVNSFTDIYDDDAAGDLGFETNKITRVRLLGYIGLAVKDAVMPQLPVVKPFPER